MQRSIGFFVLTFLIGLIPAWGKSSSTPSRLMALGCGNCHLGVEANGDLLNRLPSIASMGQRYTAAHLRKVLVEPVNIRKDLGFARMPIFPLADDELAAIVTYLKSEPATTAGPAWPAPSTQKAGAPNATDGRKLVTQALPCLSCHSYGPEGGSTAPDLEGLSKRLNATWVRHYLIDPQRILPHTPMPPLFYSRSADGYQPLTADSAAELDAVMAFLFKGETHSNHANIDPRSTQSNRGRSLVDSLRCSACHAGQNVPVAFAPNLALEHHRVQEPWLREFLASPEPIRPAGAWPGDGARMPNFRLSPREVEILITELKGLAARQPPWESAPELEPLSAYGQRKTRRLLSDKWSCLGCHQLEGEGGRVGPRLDGVGGRLKADYLHAIIANPLHAAPKMAMPKIAFRPTAAYLTQTFQFLSGLKAPKPAEDYLSLTPSVEQPETDSAKLYSRRCASCHGADGGGKGFNAPYLPVAPAQLNDGQRMAQWSDDALYNGIAVGGFVLGRHHRMPPWGETLSTEQIRGLVRHIRRLCRCEQPAWGNP